MSRFFNFYAGGTDNEIPQFSSTNYWFGFTELCLINTLKLEASDLFEAQEISAAFPPLFSLSFEIFCTINLWIIKSEISVQRHWIDMRGRMHGDIA